MVDRARFDSWIGEGKVAPNRSSRYQEFRVLTTEISGDRPASRGIFDRSSLRLARFDTRAIVCRGDLRSPVFIF